ncbi:MAG: gamma-glutamyl-gamma-aminobutyrate hydrolase family protein [Methylobacteriaceae bacterium]|nr:gamma-glutamyl-gamma-aminobutyrate hydrolase family protein [Methylobacteriaceae bacterium]
MGLRLLVVEGNVREAREAHKAAFGKTSSESYADAILAVAPDVLCDICLPADEGANLPDPGGLAGYDGIAITGSALGVYEDTPPVRRQIDFARACYASTTPFFGSCWGLQVAAAAAGGAVTMNPRGRELGVARSIVATPEGRAHRLLAGRGPVWDAPCIHRDIVATPAADTTVLAWNDSSAIQAAEIRHDGGVFWGVQYHPEYSLHELAVIIRRRIGILVPEGFFACAEDGERYCDALEAVHADPGRADIAWQLGLQPDMLEATRRLTEIRNFVEHYVRPTKSARGRA